MKFLKNIFKSIFKQNDFKQTSLKQEASEQEAEDKNQTTVNYLLVGLGNIGEKYDGTRHNIGFEVMDHLADQFDCKFELKRHAHYTSFKHKGRTFHLIKPTTFMNLSGKAVRYWIDQFKIKPENFLIVLDDLSLPFGKLRLRKKGNHGGHNGLKDIDKLMGNNQYPRLRFGIGDDFKKGRQIDYVLGKWTEQEEAELEDYIKKAADMSLSFGTIGLQMTMNQFN